MVMQIVSALLEFYETFNFYKVLLLRYLFLRLLRIPFPNICENLLLNRIVSKIAELLTTNLDFPLSLTDMSVVRVGRVLLSVLSPYRYSPPSSHLPPHPPARRVPTHACAHT